MLVEVPSQRREADFHDRWASSTQLEDVLVRECFEAPTALENQFILERMGCLQGKKILDIGAGLGESSVYFALKGARVTIADVSPGMVATALALGRRFGVELEGVVAGVEDLSVADGSYDFIYTANTIHHIRDRRLLFEQMSRALKPGGMFFSYDPLAYNPVINIYRRMATEVRTPDESPLTAADLKLAKEYFRSVGHREFWLSSLILFTKYYLKDRIHPNQDRYWKRILKERDSGLRWWKPLRAADAVLTRIPGVRWLAWNMVMWGEKPRTEVRVNRTEVSDPRVGEPTGQESRAPADPVPQFDAFCGDYLDLVSRSVRITGEPPDYFARYKAAYIARMAPPGEALLDYGCGIGLLSRQLKAQFPKTRVDGFDPSNDSLQQVDPLLQSQGTFTSKVEDLRSDYGTIVVANVLHHVEPEHRKELIRTVARRLAPGGKLIVFEHNPLNPLTRWAVSQCSFDEDAILLPVREAKRRLRASQLRILSRDYVVFFPRWLHWLRPLEERLAWLPFGGQYVLIATRNTSTPCA